MKALDSYIYYVTLFIILITFFTTLIFKKRTAIDYLNKNWRVISIGIGLLNIIIVGAYLAYWTKEEEYHRLLLGDMCAWLAAISIPVFLMGSDRFIKIIAPWMFFGGLLTMIVSQPDFVAESTYAGIVSYSKHVVLLIGGLMALTIYGRYNSKEIVSSIIFMLSFILYIILTAGVLYWTTGDEKWGIFSTALFEPSYKDYVMVNGVKEIPDYSFMKDFGLPYPVPTILFYSLSIGIQVGITNGFAPMVELIVKDKEYNANTVNNSDEQEHRRN